MGEGRNSETPEMRSRRLDTAQVHLNLSRDLSNGLTGGAAATFLGLVFSPFLSRAAVVALSVAAGHRQHLPDHSRGCLRDSRPVGNRIQRRETSMAGQSRQYCLVATHGDRHISHALRRCEPAGRRERPKAIGCGTSTFLSTAGSSG